MTAPVGKVWPEPPKYATIFLLLWEKGSERPRRLAKNALHYATSAPFPWATGQVIYLSSQGMGARVQAAFGIVRTTRGVRFLTASINLRRQGWQASKWESSSSGI